MRQATKWLWLALVLAILTLGGLILALTPEYADGRAAYKLLGIGLSFACFGFGIWLGRRLNNRNLLPQ
jgi:hypothetical protein